MELNKAKAKSSGIKIDSLGIAVDYWRVVNKPQFRYFFLTHAHSDHMDGLTPTWRRPIYCSSVTADVASHLTEISLQMFRPLELNVFHEILDGDGNVFMNVLLLDADHCPGAVMFLFTGSFGRILCTGDFRYEIDYAGNFSSDIIRSNVNVLKEAPIDRLYLDTTNWNKTDESFPSRHDATRSIIDRIKSLPKLCRVVIAFPSLYVGRENLLTAIATALEEYVCVPEDRMQVLRVLNVEDGFVTDRNEARILVVPLGMARIEFHRVSLKYSGGYLIFATSLAKQLQLNFAPENTFNAPYSDHGSRPEIERFLSELTVHKIVGVPYDLTAAEHRQFASGLPETNYEDARPACIPRSVPMCTKMAPSEVRKVQQRKKSLQTTLNRRKAINAKSKLKVTDLVATSCGDFSLKLEHVSVLEECVSKERRFTASNLEALQSAETFAAKIIKVLYS